MFDQIIEFLYVIKRRINRKRFEKIKQIFSTLTITDKKTGNEIVGYFESNQDSSDFSEYIMLDTELGISSGKSREHWK